MSNASRRWASSPRARATEALGEQRDPLGPVAVGGELGEGPREEQVADRGRGLAARAGDDGRVAAAQRRGVEDVVVDEGRHVDELDRGRGADRGLGPASGPAQSRTSIGRSRLPPAASVAAGLLGEPLAVAADELGRAAPRPPPSAAAARQLRRVDRPGSRAAGPPTGSLRSKPPRAGSPEWIAMIPPARIDVADPLEPGAVHDRRQPCGRREPLHRLGQVAVGLAVAGERAQDRHEAVEPEREEGRERRPARLGDLEDHQPAAGPQDPRQLARSRDRGRRGCGPRSRP